MSEQNKKLVLAYVEAFNRGDVDGVCALFTKDAQVWGVMGWAEIGKAKPIWKELMEGFRINLTVESLVAEGDTVAARYTERGTFAKAFRGNAATGKSYEMIAMEFFVIKEGLIHRRWGARDSASQAKQIGLPL